MNTDKKIFICMMASLAFGNCINAQSSGSLPRSTPEAQGVSSAKVREFIEAADKQINTMHSFMLVRHGHVVAECWWKPETPQTRSEEHTSELQSH